MPVKIPLRSGWHGIIEYPEIEGTQKDHPDVRVCGNTSSLKPALKSHFPFYNQYIIFSARHAFLDVSKIHSLSIGYDVNPSILKGQGMENLAACRVNLCFHLGAETYLIFWIFSSLLELVTDPCVLLQCLWRLCSSLISKCLLKREEFVFWGVWLGNDKIFSKLGNSWLMPIVNWLSGKREDGKRPAINYRGVPHPEGSVQGYCGRKIRLLGLTWLLHWNHRWQCYCSEPNYCIFYKPLLIRKYCK